MLNEEEFKEFAELKEEAKELGITFQVNIGQDKLAKKVQAHKDALEKPEPVVEPKTSTPKATKENPGSVPVESRMKRQNRLRKEAAKLIRVRVTCMNPNKKEWQGEVYTVSNSVVGTFKKFVPFDAEDGWHVPAIILKNMQAKKFQTFYTVKDNLGNNIRRGKIINELAIEILDPLTKEELKELAIVQARAANLD